MPKDDNSPAVNGEKAPLKRGDACLYCRRRRIRCSANKPQCQNCHKLNRQCEYDTGKPVSRVKQLEEKVAELEGMLKTGPDSPPSSIHQAWSYTTSDSSTSRRDLNQSNGNGNGNGNGFIDMPIDVNMPDSFSSPSGGGGVGNFGNFFPNFGSSMFGGPPSNHQPAPPPTAPTEQKPEDLFDFSTLDPSFMNLVNSFQNTSTGVPDNIQPTLPPQDNDFDAMLNCGSTGLTPFIDANMGGPPSVPPPSGSDYTSPNSAPSQFLPSPPSQSKGPSPSSSNIAYQAYVSDLSDLTEKKANNGLSATGFSFDGADASPQNVIGVSGDHPSAMGQYQHKVGVSGPMDGGLSGNHVDFDPSISGPGMGNKRKKGNGADTPGMEMVGGWFDAADLPRVARDHLLDLFFSGMRLFGQEFHIPRFFASLTLPPAKRPHPCLLYSMYLTASCISSSPSIRSLEHHFYAIAARQLDESITRADRLFDAVRAASILAVYKYSLARYHEGWMMTGQASRLAISCGLHQIVSNVFKPSPAPKDQRADLVGLMRHRSYVIPPPQDAIELGERVWAFWSIFIVERCGSISSQWPTGIADDIITSPYPRPLHEYELGLVNEADHSSISTLYDSTPAPPLPHYSDSTFVILRIRAIAVLERASKLMYLRPESGCEDRLRETMSISPDTLGAISSISPPNWLDEYLSSDWSMDPAAEQASESSRRGSATGKGWMRTAKIRTPKAFDEVKQALQAIEADLPPERRTKWGVWPEKVQDWHDSPKKDVFTLHFVLGCAWMFLFDVFSFNSQNDAAVAVARRLVATIRSDIVHDALTSDLDVFIAMTWSFIVKVLIREHKRLQAINDPSAPALEADVDVVVQALKHSGGQTTIANMQALRADRYRKSTMEDMAFMEGDTLDDEHLAPDQREYREMSVVGSA